MGLGQILDQIRAYYLDRFRGAIDELRISSTHRDFAGASFP